MGVVIMLMYYFHVASVISINTKCIRFTCFEWKKPSLNCLPKQSGGNTQNTLSKTRGFFKWLQRDCGNSLLHTVHSSFYFPKMVLESNSPHRMTVHWYVLDMNGEWMAFPSKQNSIRNLRRSSGPFVGWKTVHCIGSVTVCIVNY